MDPITSFLTIALNCRRVSMQTGGDTAQIHGPGQHGLYGARHLEAATLGQPAPQEIGAPLINLGTF